MNDVSTFPSRLKFNFKFSLHLWVNLQLGCVLQSVLCCTPQILSWKLVYTCFIFSLLVGFVPLSWPRSKTHWSLEIRLFDGCVLVKYTKYHKLNGRGSFVGTLTVCECFEQLTLYNVQNLVLATINVRVLSSFKGTFDSSRQIIWRAIEVQDTQKIVATKQKQICEKERWPCDHGLHGRSRRVFWHIHETRHEWRIPTNPSEAAKSLLQLEQQHAGKRTQMSSGKLRGPWTWQSNCKLRLFGKRAVYTWRFLLWVSTYFSFICCLDGFLDVELTQVFCYSSRRTKSTNMLTNISVESKTMNNSTEWTICIEKLEVSTQTKR